MGLVGLAAIAASVAVGVAAEGSAQLPDVPGVPSFLGSGYNILLGFPLGTPEGRDPGFAALPVANWSGAYAQRATRTFGSRVYRVPDGVIVEPDEVCSYEATATTMRAAVELQASLAGAVAVAGGGDVDLLLWRLGACAFSAAQHFNALFRSTAGVEAEYASAVARCTAYTARLAGDPQVSPPLDDVFRSRVEALKAPSDYLRLLGDYGTHYVTGMTAGGTSFYVSTFERESLASLEAAGVDIDVAARLDFLGAVGDGSLNASAGYKWQQAFHAAKSDSYRWGTPSFAPDCPAGKCDDMSSWTQHVQLPGGTPMPLKLSLAPLLQLMTPANFPSDPDIGTKRWAMATFMNVSYCLAVPDCEAPPLDMPAPVAGVDAQRSRWSKQLGPLSASPFVSWTAQPSASPAAAGVPSDVFVAADGSPVVFTADADAGGATSVATLERSTGAIRWMADVPGGARASPTSLVVDLRSGDEHTGGRVLLPGDPVAALNLSTGAARSGPPVRGDALAYLPEHNLLVAVSSALNATSPGAVTALQLDTLTPLVAGSAALASSVAAEVRVALSPLGDVLYVPCIDRRGFDTALSLAAFSLPGSPVGGAPKLLFTTVLAASGDNRWLSLSVGADGSVAAAFASAADNALRTTLVALDGESGGQRWSSNYTQAADGTGGVALTQALAVGPGGRLFALTRNASAAAASAADGAAATSPDPCSIDLNVLDKDTGAVLGRWPVQAASAAACRANPPLVLGADGTAYVGLPSAVVALSPQGGQAWSQAVACDTYGGLAIGLARQLFVHCLAANATQLLLAVAEA